MNLQTLWPIVDIKAWRRPVSLTKILRGASPEEIAYDGAKRANANGAHDEAPPHVFSVATRPDIAKRQEEPKREDHSAKAPSETPEEPCREQVGYRRHVDGKNYLQTVFCHRRQPPFERRSHDCKAAQQPIRAASAQRLCYRPFGPIELGHLACTALAVHAEAMSPASAVSLGGRTCLARETHQPMAQASSSRSTATTRSVHCAGAWPATPSKHCPKARVRSSPLWPCGSRSQTRSGRRFDIGNG